MVAETKKKILQGALTVSPWLARKPMTSYINSSLRKRINLEATIQYCFCQDYSPLLRFISSNVGFALPQPAPRKPKSTSMLHTGASWRATIRHLSRRKNKEVKPLPLSIFVFMQRTNRLQDQPSPNICQTILVQKRLSRSCKLTQKRSIYHPTQIYLEATKWGP